MGTETVKIAGNRLRSHLHKTEQNERQKKELEFFSLLFGFVFMVWFGLFGTKHRIHRKVIKIKKKILIFWFVLGKATLPHTKFNEEIDHFTRHQLSQQTLQLQFILYSFSYGYDHTYLAAIICPSLLCFRPIQTGRSRYGHRIIDVCTCVILWYQYLKFCRGRGGRGSLNTNARPLLPAAVTLTSSSNTFRYNLNFNL